MKRKHQTSGIRLVRLHADMPWNTCLVTRHATELVFAAASQICDLLAGIKMHDG